MNRIDLNTAATMPALNYVSTGPNYRKKIKPALKAIALASAGFLGGVLLSTVSIIIGGGYSGFKVAQKLGCTENLDSKNYLNLFKSVMKVCAVAALVLAGAAAGAFVTSLVVTLAFSVSAFFVLGAGVAGAYLGASGRYKQIQHQGLKDAIYTEIGSNGGRITASKINDTAELLSFHLSPNPRLEGGEEISAVREKMLGLEQEMQVQASQQGHQGTIVGGGVGVVVGGTTMLAIGSVVTLVSGGVGLPLTATMIGAVGGGILGAGIGSVAGAVTAVGKTALSALPEPPPIGEIIVNAANMLPESNNLDQGFVKELDNGLDKDIIDRLWCDGKTLYDEGKQAAQNLNEAVLDQTIYGTTSAASSAAIVTSALYVTGGIALSTAIVTVGVTALAGVGVYQACNYLKGKASGEES